MFLNVQELELRKVHFSQSFAPGQVDLLDERLRQRGPLKVEGTAELAGALGEIRVMGHITANFETECDRCLSPMEIPIDGDFNLLYRPELEEDLVDEREIRGAESEIGFYEGPGIELIDVVREQILLWSPMHPVCREDCRGICPICGQDRNQNLCGCHQDKIDERWSALKNIRS